VKPEETSNPLHEVNLRAEENASSGISVIVFEDAANQGKLIADARRNLDTVSVETEYLIVSPNSPKLAPLTGTQRASSVHDLHSAIRSAKFECIAIVDAVYKFDLSHWRVVEPKHDDNIFRTWSYRRSLAPGSRNLLVTLYCLMIRILLGIRKNRITPGMCTFSKDALTDLELDRVDGKNADAVSQLLALARSSGFRSTELRFIRQTPYGRSRIPPTHTFQNRNQSIAQLNAISSSGFPNWLFLPEYLRQTYFRDRIDLHRQ
jgi:hypothetical protein